MTLLLNPGPVTLTERVRRSLLQPDLCHREPEFFDLQDEARERLPIVENGVYGERSAQICAQYRIDHERLCGDWMQAPDLDVVAARLGSTGGTPFTHVAIVHHETTTGRLNDLQALGALAQAVARTYYLDLGRLAHLQDQRDTPFTPAVHTYYALVEALREFAEQGGRAARHGRHAVLHDALKAGGFVIYAGQGNMAKTLFRISTMGNLTAADIDRLLTCFARLLG